MIDLMADSTKILRQLREQTPLEEIDDTIDDLQSELDGLQDINDCIGSIGNNISSSHTDEELLAELQSLSIEDQNVPTATPAVSATVTAPTPKMSKKSQYETPVVSEKNGRDSAAVEKQPVLA